MEWHNPGWTRPDNNNGRGCDVAVTDCSTYEHDLKLDKLWFRSGVCTTWSNLPRSYDDCPTSGFSDPAGKRIVSFGTYKAPAIESGKVYYGSWMLSSLQTFRVTGVQTTTVELHGQEGAFRPGGEYQRITCRKVYESPWCVYGLSGKQRRLVPDASSSSTIEWTRGTASYHTFRRR